MDDEALHEVAIGILEGRRARRFRLVNALRLKLRRNADRLPHFQPVARVGASAVNANLPGAQQLFERPMAKRRIMPFEPAVETQARLALLHCCGRAHARLRTSQRPPNSAPTDSRTEPII